MTSTFPLPQHAASEQHASEQHASEPPRGRTLRGSAGRVSVRPSVLALLCAVAFLCVSVPGCSSEGDTEPFLGPTVVTFASSALELARGETVTLTWRVEHARSLSLVALGEGAVPGSPLEQNETGSVEVTVVRDTTFVLTAYGDNGQDARQLTVLTRLPPTSGLFLTLTPPELVAGESGTLVWNTHGAGTPVLRTSKGETVDLGGQEAAGSLRVSPLFDETYTLEVAGRSKQASVRVLPAILELASATPSATSGAPLTLSWRAGGATRVTLSTPGRGELVAVTERARIETGNFSDDVPAGLPENGVLRYELVATDGVHEARQFIQLYVGVNPTIVRFDVPATVAAGSTFAAAWQTKNADQIQLLVGGRVVYQSPSVALAADGRFTIPSPVSKSDVELRATNDRGGFTKAVKQIEPLAR